MKASESEDAIDFIHRYREILPEDFSGGTCSVTTWFFQSSSKKIHATSKKAEHKVEANTLRIYTIGFQGDADAAFDAFREALGDEKNVKAQLALSAFEAGGPTELRIDYRAGERLEFRTRIYGLGTGYPEYETEEIA